MLHPSTHAYKLVQGQSARDLVASIGVKNLVMYGSDETSVRIITRDVTLQHAVRCQDADLDPHTVLLSARRRWQFCTDELICVREYPVAGRTANTDMCLHSTAMLEVRHRHHNSMTDHITFGDEGVTLVCQKTQSIVGR